MKGQEKAALKAMSMQELEAKLREAQASYFRLKFRHTGSPLKNPMQIRLKRQEIARLKTWLHGKAQTPHE